MNARVVSAKQRVAKIRIPEQYILSGFLKAKSGAAQIRWLLAGKVPVNSGAPKRISAEVIGQLIGGSAASSDCGFDMYEEAIQRIIQLPIEMTPMVALAYLYHGSSEFYIEDVFSLSESSEHPLNFGSMMTLVSGSDEANLCYSKINQEEWMSPETYRESHNSVTEYA